MVTDPRPIDGDPYPPPEAVGSAQSPRLLRDAFMALGAFLLVFSATFLLGGRGTLGGPNLGESASSARELVPTEPPFQTFGFFAANPELLLLEQVPTAAAPADSGSSPVAPASTDGAAGSDADAAPDGSGRAPAAVALTAEDESEADEPPAASASGVEDPEPAASATPAAPPPAPRPLPPQGGPVIVAPPPTATPPPPPPPTPVPATPPPPPPPPAPAAASVSLHPLESSLLATLNAERAAAGLTALQPDPTLVSIARSRSNDMAQRDYFDHVNPDGGTVFDMLAQLRVPYAWAGENLALNNYPVDETVAVTVRELMASPPHRANILNVHYTMVGVGIATGSDGLYYFTMVFVGF